MAKSLYQQKVFQPQGASRSGWKEAECKLKNVNFRRKWDPRGAFLPAIRATRISDNWYGSAMGLVVIRLGTSGTVAQQMHESQSNSERSLHSDGLWFDGLQAISEILRMYTSKMFTLHTWYINCCLLSTSKSYYSMEHLIQHFIVCIAILNRITENIRWFKNEHRSNQNNILSKRLNEINRT